MSSEKKCPNCGEWSSWSGDLDDTCDHCGAYLSPAERKNRQEKETRDRQQEENWMFHYDNDASVFEKIYKKTGNFIYMIIMAIVSFIMWLFLWLGP